MKKLSSIFSFIISHFSSPRGFTLIEMLVVFAIIGSLTVGGVNSFFSYSRNQSFRTAVSDVSHALNDVRTRAISQVKPSPDCDGKSLNGYEFWFPTPGTYYRIRVQCGGTYYVLTRTNLPANITFATGSTSTTFFRVGTGTVASAKTIIITGYGNTNTITVNTSGVVSVE